MAKLIITRKTEYANALRDYKIFLNGKKIGKISNGETKEFVISEGINLIRAKIDWCGSQELELNINGEETTSVAVSGYWPVRYNSLFISFIIIIPIIFKEFIRDHQFLRYSFLVLSIIALLWLIYYLTLGRNSFLKIKENPARI